MTDREKLIELVNEADDKCDRPSCTVCSYLHGEDCRGELIADHLIARGVTFATDTNVGSKWISVEDGMPEPMVWVLCACRANIIEVLRYDRNIDGWGTAGLNRGYMKSFVTHWIPLPEAPKVQEVPNGTDHV